MRALAVTALLALMSCTGSVAAAGIEKLLMPGEVIEGHADFEQECTQCHDRGDRSRNSQLCLACHKDIAADSRTRRGYHGRMPNAERAQCNACHSEHQGRKADIVKFSAASFDHKLTDFPLVGSHASAACGSCHVTGKPFREASSECAACHKDRDAHQGQLGRNCGSCHNATAWTDTKFDHSTTKFPLTGSHAQTTCAACHAGNKFAGTPKQCVSCHAIDDVHRGTRGASCSNCHETRSWKTSRFDHAREANFALLGAHSNLQCQQCHRSGDFKAQLPRTCEGCHRSDDAHATRFGGECSTCHTNEAWRPSPFDHSRDAHFALLGSHRDLACHRCHTATLRDHPVGKECSSCHKLDDAHGGTAGLKCEQCHGNDNWSPAIGFDHDLTRFPLVGMHVVVPCAACHENHAFSRTAAGCNDCHSDRDVHRGNLGTACHDCHTPNSWQLWEFDHATTQFPLTGAHEKLQCAQCHREPAAKVQLARDCAACHQQDDVHLGQFGRQCQQCHSTTTFKGGRRR